MYTTAPFAVWDCQHWISINQVKSATSCALRIKVTLLQNLNICNNLVYPLENNYDKIHIYSKEVMIFLGCFSRQNNDMFCFNNLWYKFSIFLFIVLSSCQAKNFWYLQKFFFEWNEKIELEVRFFSIKKDDHSILLANNVFVGKIIINKSNFGSNQCRGILCVSKHLFQDLYEL